MRSNHDHPAHLDRHRRLQQPRHRPPNHRPPRHHPAPSSLPRQTSPSNARPTSGPEATGSATAQDTGSAVTVRYADALSDSCGNAGNIQRTWTATDSCGNSASAVQIIIVYDITAPVITGVSDRCVGLDQAWDFAAPVATDTCSDASIAMVSTTTEVYMDNVLVVSRLWQASDACSNTSTFEELVTVGSVPAIRSTFNTSPESWQVVSTSTPQSPLFCAFGGNQGGYVCIPAVNGQTSCSWTAPENYLGDRLPFYGGVLTFALKQGSSAGPVTAQVELSGAGLTLVLNLEPLPDTSWTTYAVRLQENAGWLNQALQRPATQAEIISVLGDLTQLVIHVNFGSASTLVGLDSVIMAPPMTTPDASWLLQIQRSQPGHIQLRWPVLATGCQLEESQSLTTPNWKPVETAPVAQDGFNVVEVATLPTPKFYRLHRIAQ